MNFLLTWVACGEITNKIVALLINNKIKMERAMEIIKDYLIKEAKMSSAKNGYKTKIHNN